MSALALALACVSLALHGVAPARRWWAGRRPQPEGATAGSWVLDQERSRSARAQRRLREQREAEDDGPVPVKPTPPPNRYVSP